MERILGNTVGEQRMVSMRCEPLRYVLKVGWVGKRWFHGSISPVDIMSLSSPERGFSAVSLKSPPNMMSCWSDWNCLTCSVRS